MMLSAVAAALLALRGLRRLQHHAHRLQPWQLCILCMASVVAATMASQPVEGRHEIATVVLFPFLAAAAFVDLRTGWAPDELMIPICVLAGLAAPQFVAGHVGLVAGIALYIGGRVVWHVQVPKRIPPADCIALASPFLLFESLMRAASLFMLAALLASLLLVRRWRRQRSRKIALLAVAFPIDLVCLSLR